MVGCEDEAAGNLEDPAIALDGLPNFPCSLGCFPCLRLGAEAVFRATGGPPLSRFKMRIIILDDYDTYLGFPVKVC